MAATRLIPMHTIKNQSVSYTVHERINYTIINYVKTRDIYTVYRKAGYSKKFLAEHESEILLHKAAEKKRLYPEYSRVRQEMRDLQMARANVARLMGYEEKETGRKKGVLRQ